MYVHWESHSRRSHSRLGLAFRTIFQISDFPNSSLLRDWRFPCFRCLTCRYDSTCRTFPPYLHAHLLASIVSAASARVFHSTCGPPYGLRAHNRFSTMHLKRIPISALLSPRQTRRSRWARANVAKQQARSATGVSEGEKIVDMSFRSSCRWSPTGTSEQWHKFETWFLVFFEGIVFLWNMIDIFPEWYFRACVYLLSKLACK